MENRWGVILLLLVSLPWPLSVKCLDRTSEADPSSSVLAALSYPSIRIGPYSWRYFRVEVPSAFAELSILLTRKWTGEHVGNYAGNVPLVCFRLGSPPLPDSVLESPQAAAMVVGKAEYPVGTGKCAWFHSNSSIALTNMQIVAGVWYVGVFSDPQPSRFQSKMCGETSHDPFEGECYFVSKISRGNIFTFGIHFTVLGCKSPNLRGRDCSVTVKPLYGGTSDQGLTSGRDERDGRDGRDARDERDGCYERDELDGRDERDGRDGVLTRDHGRGMRGSSAAGGAETWTSLKSQVVGPDEWKHFVLEVADFASVLQVRVNGTSTGEAKFYVKYGALPGEGDNGTALGSAPVSVPVPRRGPWYIGVHNADVTRALDFDLDWRVESGSGDTGTGALNPMERVLVEDALESPFNSFYGPTRPEGQQPSPSSPWFLISELPHLGNNNNATSSGNWTYMFIEVPRGAGGAVLSLQLRHVVHASMHVYARFQGLATPDHWDVQTTNTKKKLRSSHVNNNNNSPVEQNHEEEVSIDLVYPAEGVWCIAAHYTKLAGSENGDDNVVKSALKLDVSGRVVHFWRNSVKFIVQWYRRFVERLKVLEKEFRDAVSSYVDSSALENAPGLPGNRTDDEDADVGPSDPLYAKQPLIELFNKKQDLEAVQMHIRVHGCVNKCSGKGHCVTTYESSRLHFISNCHCDAAHGGIDCSVSLLVPTEQSLHVWTLIGSNSAALLPSFWAIRHHAYSEWVSYVASGVSSGFYHSCDAGGWCALSYDTLQFLDFWLSFMVVIMTCLSVAAFKQDTKAVAHVAAAIITAAITKENATSAWNVLLVVLMGLAGLLLGWALECWRLRLLPSWFRAIGPNLRPVMQMNSIYHRIEQLLGVIRARFQWLYLFSGLGILFAAGLSWVLETADTYWIWHSLWHLSIYTSAFLILCSTSKSSWRLSEGNPHGYERANLHSLSDPEALPSLLHPVELDAFASERDRILGDQRDRTLDDQRNRTLDD